jgi:hypothetical protein
MATTPVLGYRDQTDGNVMLVNESKIAEEKLLRVIEQLDVNGIGDKRWLAIAKTHLEQGFMALNRAIFKPERVQIPPEAT